MIKSHLSGPYTSQVKVHINDITSVSNATRNVFANFLYFYILLDETANN
tara:strand:- start:44 stop:190 length:147 start_codon:yes stop_codon:yes gene_type:complete